MASTNAAAGADSVAGGPRGTRLDRPAGIPIGSETMVWSLYQSHYEQMCRLARLLMGGNDAAEDIAQESFIRLFGARERLTDTDHALAYLRTTVVNLTRSRWRRAVVAIRHAPKALPERAGPDEEAIDSLGRAAVVDALKRLPTRQRESIVLRYYADLSEVDTAATLGITVGSVKGYTSRGLASLAEMLKERPS